MHNHIIRVSVLSVLLFLCMSAIGLASLFGLAWYVYLWAVFPFFALNIFPFPVKRPSFPIRMVSEGADLLCAFLVTAAMQCFYTVWAWFSLFNRFSLPFFVHLIAVILFLSLLFWNGVLRVYCTASMIGLKWRILGVLCGYIPIANLIVLAKIISLSYLEVRLEEERDRRNCARQNERICSTKYPIVLIHGVFFRDTHFFNYWGRIPKELQKNGAKLFYGGQQSALPISESAQELVHTIRHITESTGCGKVNLIAHSKGGLDCRYAITHLGMGAYVASLTTINTPHYGCVFADWLLNRVSPKIRDTVARSYNAALRKLGDRTPDFLGAVNDLRASSCKKFNEQTPDIPGVYYQSVGSHINRPLRGIFPLCFSYALVRYFDGPNDGLVNESAARWGQRFFCLSSESDGISHADVIDLMRHDKPDFDVREFYVQLVSDLKQKGL